MHNPFPLYSERLLDALIKAGHKYFVRQTYKRGFDHFDTEQRGSFLITHYNDLNKANIHYEALTNDGNRFLYDISNSEHLEKLRVASRQPVGYKIYTPLLQQEWKPSPQIAQGIRRYIDYKLRWKPAREETVQTNLFTQFGELFITLKFRIQEVKVPLADIEKV
jgi:hypothetical protein